jgi:hypothetical protein
MTQPTFRRAERKDAHAIASLFQLTYAESSHPCKCEEFVARSLQRRRTDLWHVSESEGCVTGCMSLHVQSWNRVWEIGRGVVHPDYRRGGLATSLAQCMLDEAYASPDCDFVIGYPRSRSMFRIMTEGVTPIMRAIGHDGGINIAEGRREFHLVGISATSRANLVRHAPPDGTNEFVTEEILNPLGFGGPRSRYPPTVIAGDTPRHPDYGPFTFSYHPFCPSDALEISGYTGIRQDQREIARDLIQTIRSFSYARHVRLAVLADKLDFQGALEEAGFRVSAYLPAWHLQNGIRYDCKLLTWLAPGIHPVDHGLRDLIDQFDQGLKAC